MAFDKSDTGPGTHPRPSLSDNTDIWERTGWLWSALFFVLLGVSAVIALLNDDLTTRSRTIIVVLSLALAVMHVALVAYLRRTPDFRELPVPWIPLLYVALSLVMWTILTIQHPAFYLLLFSLYSQLFSVLRLVYAVPASIILTLLIGYTQNYDGNLIPAVAADGINAGTVVIYALMAVAGVLLSLWINAIIRQSAQRRELIAELQQAQAELAESERQAGRLAERQRLAREIHDTLAQGFTSIVMNMEAAEQALPDDTTTAVHHIDITRQIARTNLEQARRVVADLRPELLEQEPLPIAIERVVGNWAAQTGITATAVATGDPIQLHPEIEVTLLRATQEALANVRKHAHATSACVTLSYMDDLVILDVQDDGVGMGNGRGQADPGGGFGLTAMRERIDMLRGELDIESSAEDGTTISVQIPIGDRV